MARPQLENGHTQIANEILEHLMKLHLSPNQWQVLLCIIRKTYGFHKKVDYIANSQIVTATGLCKAVVSRCLHTLKGMNILTRTGKHIGFQKDWEAWGKLAEQSTQQPPEVSSIANLVDNKSKQFDTYQLAVSSTKVSSCDVAQKIKDTLTKERALGAWVVNTTTPPVIKNNVPQERPLERIMKAYREAHTNDPPPAIPPGKPVNQMTYAERMTAITNNPNIIPEKLPARQDRGGFRSLKDILADVV